jgi:hypothetical protein
MDWQYKVSMWCASFGLVLMANGLPHEVGSINWSGGASYVAGVLAGVATVDLIKVRRS